MSHWVSGKMGGRRGREGKGRGVKGRGGEGTGEEDGRWVDSCMHTYHMNECMCVQYCCKCNNLFTASVFICIALCKAEIIYTCVLVYVLLCGCLLACTIVTSLQETVLCVLCAC